MRQVGSQAERENLPVLETYRQGLVIRWNEMMNAIEDETAFSTRMRMMIAEVKTLARTDEQRILDSKSSKLMEQDPERFPDETSVFAEKLNVLSNIFRTRVVSARWILPFDSDKRGFGQVATSVQQNIQANFFKLDYRSLFETYFFCMQIEMILHNIEDANSVHMAVTYHLKNWSMKWGLQPYGVNKWNPLESLDGSKRGAKTELRKRIEKDEQELLDASAEEFGSQNEDIPLDNMKGQPFHPDMNIEKFLEENGLKDNVEFKSRPNYLKLLHHDHLKLLKYRDRSDYRIALTELQNIIKLEFEYLKTAKVNLLQTYVPFNQTQTVPMS